MITQGADVEIAALKKQGWSLSAIARHVGHDRKTVRAYLRGEREAGVRRRVVSEEPFDRFEVYVRQRFADDPHVWATVLFDEVVALGFDRSYQRFTYRIVDSVPTRPTVWSRASRQALLRRQDRASGRIRRCTPCGERSLGLRPFVFSAGSWHSDGRACGCARG
jgi:hypothetical protein